MDVCVRHTYPNGSYNIEKSKQQHQSISQKWIFVKERASCWFRGSIRQNYDVEFYFSGRINPAADFCRLLGNLAETTLAALTLALEHFLKSDQDNEDRPNDAHYFIT